jgi:aerobic-type carbon monoxide dehydrogenase small subunit (CoxS/CutS family)
MSSAPKILVRLRVNGRRYEVAVRPAATLLDVLREELLLTGSHRGCDMGTCGCCTVLIDGRALLSCLTLAAEAEDKEITTIEGLHGPEKLHPVQEAFLSAGGSQCGFCTPGFIMTSVSLLRENPHPSEQEIREAISGNMCRCTGYVKIVDAVMRAAEELRGTGGRVDAPVGTGLRGRRNDDGSEEVVGAFKGRRPPRGGGKERGR